MISAKDLIKLTQKKYRREMGLCIVEGEKLVREHRDNAVAVFTREQLGNDYAKITNLETPEGILAVCKIPDEHIASMTYPFLILDGIQDPGNVGTLLRTASAFGFKTVFLINCADVWSQKVIRSAMGMQFHLIIIDVNYEEFFELYKAHLEDSILYFGDMTGGDKAGTLPEKYGLVLGSEGQGISKEIRKLPHKTISIPMSGSVESLNVAVAGGILLYILTK